MSTGRIIAPGHFQAGTMGPLGVRGSYAPSTFMEMDVGGLYSPFPEYFSYATGGVKVQVLGQHGWFGGLAAGADFGLLYGRGDQNYRGSLMAYNVATSLGDGSTMLHLNATALPYGTTDTATLNVEYLLQAGLSVPFLETSDRGYKAVLEYTAGGRTFGDMHGVFAAAGVRSSGRRFVWEAGLVLGPRCFGDCADSGMMLYKIPYLSVMFVLN